SNALWKTILDGNAKDVDAPLPLGASACNLGNALSRLGKSADAIPSYDLAIKHLSPLHARFKQDGQIQEFLRNSHRGRAEARASLKRYREALADWDLVMELERQPDEVPGNRARRAVTLARLERDTAAAAGARQAAAS